MSKELVIGSNRHETKVAILEEDQLVEVYFQRGKEYSLAGSIHKGRVTRVLPGMQSAFVDLGLERDTFLYVSDFFEEHEDIDTVSDDKPNAREDRRQVRENGRSFDQAHARGIERRNDRDYSPAPLIETAGADIAPPEVDSAEPANTGNTLSNVEPVSPQAGEQAKGEGGARGDRGWRRSRRRRSHGRGFPENKYAQPSGETRSTGGQVEPAEEESSSKANREEVVILPGESLAKYKTGQDHPNASNESLDAGAAGDPDDEQHILSNEERSFVDRDLREEGSDDPADAAEEADNTLDEEADEIETADLVLGHHPEEAEEEPEEGEQRASATTAEVTSLFLVSEAGSEEAVIVSETHDAILMDPHPVIGQLDLADEEIDEVSPASAFVTPGSLSTDEQPASESGEVKGPQTATLREPNERSMHRAPRRMRRRRGGNRFSNHGQDRTESNTTNTAVAPALDREPHRESRVEITEERNTAKPERIFPSITDLLKPGQEIIVQIAKEPLGQKGARITSHIALPGRYVVFMPSVEHLGVSRKIASDEERQRLKQILRTHRVGTTGGFIVRTAGEGIPENEIAADMNFLYSLWVDIRGKAEKKPAPMLLHCDLDIVQRILRDQVTDEYKAIWVDNEELYESVLRFMQRFQPALVARVKMYTRSAPIFDAFNITQELEKALRPKVWLKSGGYIVINQTEALVAIDINTGKYVGKSNRLEDTIVKTNIEAVKEIVRQVRLRDLGGIIVVDFIDMDERKNRQKVMQALEEAMQADKAPYKILQFNDFGLVAITRKRVKQSLERTLCSPCPHCEGAGYIKSVQTTIGELLTEAQKLASAIEGKDVVLRVHPEVAKVLKASSNQYLEELEEILGRPVLVRGDAMLHEEKFDLG